MNTEIQTGLTGTTGLEENPENPVHPVSISEAVETISFEELKKAAVIVFKTHKPEAALHFAKCARFIPVPPGETFPTIPIIILRPDESICCMSAEKLSRVGLARK